MILLLGGTTEAKEVAAWLDAAGKPYIYSTRTEVKFEGKGAYRCGALDQKALEAFCYNNGISCIVNACHPFAQELHETVVKASLAPVSLIRYERAFPERIKHPLVQYVKDYEAAMAWAEKRGCTSLLALSGVQSIPLLKSFWQKHRCWFRILDRPYSRDFARQHHFPEEGLLFGLPQEEAQEIKLFRQLRPAMILTKESGWNGKLDAKIAAALACQIPIAVIQRPSLNPAYKLARSQQDLFRLLP